MPPLKGSICDWERPDSRIEDGTNHIMNGQRDGCEGHYIAPVIVKAVLPGGHQS